MTEQPSPQTTPAKTLPEYFRDWEASTFGFGYGTGEEHTIPAVRLFMESMKDRRSYDYRDLERAFGPLAAWLLINALARDPGAVIEYGTSPRFGWLTSGGETLRDFMLEYSNDELSGFTNSSENDMLCYPDTCNCGPNGYEEGRICSNPFWGR